MRLEGKKPNIKPLIIGDGKLKKTFEINYKFLKDWFIEFTIRWR